MIRDLLFCLGFIACNGMDKYKLRLKKQRWKKNPTETNGANNVKMVLKLTFNWRC